MKTILLALILALFVILAAPAQPDALGQAAPPAPIEDLVFSADDLVPETLPGIGLFEDEVITILPGGAIFTSDIIATPIPFNAVVPQWRGENASAVELQIRTSPDGQIWSDWYHAHAHADWFDPDSDEVVGEMVLVNAPDSRHAYIQFQILLSEQQETTLLPSSPLNQLRLTFIDSTAGPTTEELVLMQQELEDSKGSEPDILTTYPKPFVVSRDAWCQHEDCNYTEGLEYQRVSHLIVHHTVSSNTSSDWAAVVRAIWNFHTYNRGWGDIGYNYLVDPNGVIYEGHNGGDDVVGTHAAGANTGSMAVSLLGTFTQPDQTPPGIRPPQKMLDSTVELLSWKADQRDINIFEASRALPEIKWGLPHLMGHRDVYGTTVCPGDQAHLLIPWLREQIAARIGLIDPYIYADEMSTAFTRSNNENWFVPPFLCGYNNHSWYTWSTTNPGESTNWGEWRPNVPASGRYRIEVHVPYCRTGRAETAGAAYTIFHADGASTRTIDQNTNVGLWNSLGEFNLNQGNGNVIRLTDLTTTDTGVGVWFDALRLLPLEEQPPPPLPTVTNLQPANGTWQVSRVIPFTWQINNPQTVTMTTLQIALDPAFSNVLINQSWIGVVTTYNQIFIDDYPNLYWRVLLTRANQPLLSSTPTQFSLDATPPQSAVRSPLVYLPLTGNYIIDWEGTDNLSIVDRYRIDFRLAGGVWERWLTDTPLTTAIFYPPDPAMDYEFRSQAIDRAGNIEPVVDVMDADTAEALILGKASYMPRVWR